MQIQTATGDTKYKQLPRLDVFRYLGVATAHTELQIRPPQISANVWPEILSNTFNFLQQFLGLLVLTQNPPWIPSKAWNHVPTNMHCFFGKTCRHWLALIQLIGFLEIAGGNIIAFFYRSCC